MSRFSFGSHLWFFDSKILNSFYLGDCLVPRQVLIDIVQQLMRYTRESQAVFEDIVGEPVYVRCRILVKIGIKAEVASLLHDDISLLPGNLLVMLLC